MIEITAGMKELLNETNPTNIEARLSELAARQPQFETLAQAGVRLVLSGKTTLAQIMGITGDITWVPRFKRFEQILVQQAIINGDQVDDAYGAIDEAFQQGVVMRLDRYLLDNGVCTADQIDEAMRMSHASGI
jgi:general secretion pathway protein E